MNSPGILRVALLAFLPISEVRGALPYGVFVEKLPLSLVISVAFVSNIAPFFLVMYALPLLVRLFLRLKWFNNLWQWYTQKAQSRFSSYRRYGKWGILFFVGIPLPFTGMWTGALVSFLAGFKVWEIFPFTVGGVALATFLVSFLVLLGKTF